MGEFTGLLMKSPLSDVDQIYTLCKNARQFLGIEDPPPDPVYPEESPEAPAPGLPREYGNEALDDDEDTLSSGPIPMPREPTPEMKVSQRERIPLSVPAAPKPITP